ncbi:MAG: branched-chain amino acid ABC transporter permease [Gemmatimonadaceae bacterium]|nr:branched-chain amino acid ABC transporter permease [Acetobacteraceae bacterium]
MTRHVVPLLFLLAVPLPWLLGAGYTLQVANLALLNAIAVVGLNFVTGWTGQISFGQAAFAGIGAYVTAVLSLAAVPFPVALLLALVVAAGAGLLLGLPTLRLRTFYLAMATIGFGEIVRLVLLHWEGVTGGSSGLRRLPGIGVGPYVLEGEAAHFWLLLAVLGLTVLAAVRIRESWLGRAMLATRDAEIAAELAGVDTVRVKVAAFMLAAVYAALSGGLYAGYVRYVSPDGFTNQQAVLLFTMLVLGGIGSIPGAVAGAAVLTILPELLRGLGEWYLVIYGLGVIALVAFLPGGLAGLARRVRP